MQSQSNKLLFMVISFLLWFPHFLYVPILSPYMNYKGISYAFTGIVLGSYGVMQLLLRIPIGVGSDLLKNKKMFILLGMFVSFLSCTIFVFAENEWWLLLARTLAGAGAASWVAFTIMYTGFFFPDKVTAAMGSISFIIVLAQYISMSISGLLIGNFGWQSPFYLATAFSFIGFILTMFIKERKTKKDEKQMRLKDVPSVAKDKTLLKAAMLSVLAHRIRFATIFGFMPNVALSIWFEEGSLIYVLSAFIIRHDIATLCVENIIVPKIGIHNALFISFIIVSVSLFLTPLSSNEILFLICQVFTGFGLGVIFPVLLGLPIQNISDEKKATAMGVYQSLYAIGIFAGPYLSGIMNTTFNLSAGYYLLTILGIIGIVFIKYWSAEKQALFKKVNHS